MKYYVTSGDLEEIVVSNSPKEAALIAVQRKFNKTNENFALGVVTQISETGFMSSNDDDLYWTTSKILEELGLEDYFNEIDNV